MLRLASLSAVVFSLVALAACNNANIASGGTGGGGSGGGNTGGGTTSSTSSGSNTCQQAGGTCVALTPNPCVGGYIGDASMYSCGGGVGVGCCLFSECFTTCGTVGATRCLNGVIETCSSDGSSGCTSWKATSACDNGQTCNSNGTACVTPSTTCSTDNDCGCGCGCSAGMCHCTGGIPETCSTDMDCGPACAGFKCTGGKCVAPVCTPGQDQTCNHVLSMNAFAGTCQADGTCTCMQGFVMFSDGKCGPATP